MKKFLSIILCCLIVFSLVGCGAESEVIANVSNGSYLTGQAFGKSAMVEIGNYLYYDSTTRIVYWWNGILQSYRSDTVPTPYYAPNGLPYLYNPQTNTFEEIEK